MVEKKEPKKEVKKEEPKYNPWNVLKYPHLAEKSMNMVELENKLILQHMQAINTTIRFDPALPFILLLILELSVVLILPMNKALLLLLY